MCHLGVNYFYSVTNLGQGGLIFLLCNVCNCKIVLEAVKNRNYYDIQVFLCPYKHYISSSYLIFKIFTIRGDRLRVYQRKD